MNFKDNDFVKLKERTSDVVMIEKSENKNYTDEERAKIKTEAFKSGFSLFQIIDENKKIKLFCCRLEGTENELLELRREVKSRAARVYVNMWNTTGFLSFLSNVHYKNRWFDEKGWDKEILGASTNHEPATSQQILFAESMIEKRINNYTELIRMRTFLRIVQATDDEFKEKDTAKIEANARLLLLKKDIVCSHIYKDKELKIVRKGRRACCEPCAAAGYLNPDIEFGKKIKDGVEIGFIKSL